MQDAWRAYLELALGLTEASRKRAMQVARQMIGKGGATAEQLQTIAEELLRTSTANRDAMTKLVRYELDRALAVVGLATAEEVADLDARVRDLEQRLQELEARGPEPQPAGPAGAAASETSTASQAAAGKAAAKKVTAKKVTTKKSEARRAEAKKAVAKKAVAKKAAAKKAGAA